MRYSVCANSLFPGMPVHQTLEAIRAAGYDQYEFWGWWDQDVDALEKAQRRADARPAAFCTRLFPLNQPEMRQAFLAGLEESLAVAQRLSCPTLIAQAGQDVPGMPYPAQHQSIVQGLKDCVPALERAGVTLALEPLNTRIDHVGHYLWRAGEAFEIVDEVGSPRVKVLYDLYHQYIMEKCPIEEITLNIGKIAHFHMAGYPGRHEPLIDSEIDYAALLPAIEGAGYRGCVGLEYFPLRDAEQGLRDFAKMVRR